MVKVETAGFSENLTTTCQTARCHDTEDYNPKCQGRVEMIIQFVKKREEES